MTDKVFERANQIKDELFKLELLKKELKFLRKVKLRNLKK